jgi:hypothetical protein
MRKNLIGRLFESTMNWPRHGLARKHIYEVENDWESERNKIGSDIGTRIGSDIVLKKDWIKDWVRYSIKHSMEQLVKQSDENSLTCQNNQLTKVRSIWHNPELKNTKFSRLSLYLKWKILFEAKKETKRKWVSSPLLCTRVSLIQFQFEAIFEMKNVSIFDENNTYLCAKSFPFLWSLFCHAHKNIQVQTN